MPYCCGYYTKSVCSKCGNTARLIPKKEYKQEIEELQTEVLNYMAEQWLLERGITKELAREFGLSWCNNVIIDNKACGCRLIIPVYEENPQTLKKTLVWWQGRDITGLHKIKYVSPSNTIKHYWKSIKFPAKKEVYIVEDVMSGIRLSSYVNVIALQGNNLSNGGLTQLFNFKKLILWLDQDKGGEDGTLKLLKDLPGLFEIKCVNAKEPKLLTDKEIEDLLKDEN